MLILVSVTVKTAVSSGLFGHAKNATQRWADEQRKEENIGDDIDKIIADQVEGIHSWIRNGDDIYCEYCNLKFVIGDYLDYKPDITSKTVTIGKEEAGLLETDRNSSDKIDPNTVNDQVFTQQTVSYWQVLGIEDSDRDGKNETLLIKMAGGTTTLLRLKGASAYNNGPEIMNRICKELYSSDKYGEARSINITDVNNTLQYTPKGGQYTEGSVSKEINGFDMQIKELPAAEWEALKASGTYTPDGTNTEEKIGSYKINGYYYRLHNLETGVTNYVEDETTTNVSEATKDIIFKMPSGNFSYYWLACRGVYGGAWTIFGPGNLGGALVRSHSNTFYARGMVQTLDYPVTPVVSLKSGIPPKIAPPTSIPEPVVR